MNEIELLAKPPEELKQRLDIALNYAIQEIEKNNATKIFVIGENREEQQLFIRELEEKINLTVANQLNLNDVEEADVVVLFSQPGQTISETDKKKIEELANKKRTDDYSGKEYIDSKLGLTIKILTEDTFKN